MFEDYFKANPGVKDLPSPEIEPQSPSPQLVVIAMSYNDPNIQLGDNSLLFSSLSNFSQFVTFWFVFVDA